MEGRVLCLIGAQYGSEGKGVIAAHLAPRFDVHVRVGGPNAGHTFRYRGQLWKMRSLPCGWINRNATLVIGAGAVVDLPLLIKEIGETGTDPKRVYVDQRAAIIEKSDQEGENYALREAIGATGEGVGPTRVRRMLRGQEKYTTAGDVALRRTVTGDELPFRVCDTVELLWQARLAERSVLLEGTQGTMLSLVHGRWPYVTSHDTTAAQILADTGIPPTDQVDVLLVARTFPIRVGGNSGTLPLETTWDEVSKVAGRKVDEYTTVTHRLRRVARWYQPDVRKAVILNGPQSIALMFLDYVFGEIEGAINWHELSQDARAYVMEVERSLGIFVQFIGTGGPNLSVIERSVNHA